MEEILKKKILVVDDTTEIREMVCDILQKNGYGNLVAAASFSGALSVFAQEEPDLAILDIMLPDGNGYLLFQEIRSKSDIPILFLSAKDEDADKILGLGLGADDYITKPFLPQELLLRVGAILRRCYGRKQRQQEEVLQLGETLIFLDRAEAVRGSETMALTATELAILKKLAANRGNIVTFDSICQYVWHDDYYGYENNLMVHIRHIRQKIEENPSQPRWLLTVRGVGYRLV